ncbi:MAG: copper amine oxidase N-terminal domain-containing protein [Caldisericia bacterium]|nr:copper amine oxidase N-terminal domain-containing protein [Caldisericia bacterium]
MKRIKVWSTIVFILAAFFSLTFSVVEARVEGLNLSYSPAPLTAGCVPELIDPEEPFTIIITDDEGYPVDLTQGGEIEDEVVWKLLFIDHHPKTLGQYYWTRTDLHNDDSTLVNNENMFGFRPITIDFSHAKEGKYIFKGFCANDAGKFFISVYTPDRRQTGHVEVEVVNPIVTYEIVNTEDPEQTVFTVPGEPDFTLTAGDNRLYEVTAIARNAQGKLIAGINKDLNICGGAKEVARFTPFTTRPANFEFNLSPSSSDGEYRLNHSVANYLLNDGGRYYLHLGIDYNLNGYIDYRNKESHPMSYFNVRDLNEQGTISTLEAITYYVTSNIQWEDGSFVTEPQFDISESPYGWGLGCIYNNRYEGGYLFADINEDGRLDYHDSLLFDAQGRCKFYIFADDVTKIGGLVACNPYGNRDVSGGPPDSENDPTKIEKRYQPEYVFYLDFDAMPNLIIGSGQPSIKAYDAKTGIELSKTGYNKNNYDLIYSIENHIDFVIKPADNMDIPLDITGVVSLKGNQDQNSIYGRLQKITTTKTEIVATMFFTPTGIGDSVITLDVYFENKRQDSPNSFKLEKVMYLDSVLGGGISVTPSSIFVDEDNDVTILVTQLGTNRPVEGATVNASGCGIQYTGRTDKDGRCYANWKPTQTGDIVVKATIEGMQPGETTIPVIKRDIKLFLEVDPLPAIANKSPVTVKGRTLPNLPVLAKMDEHEWKTDSDDQGGFSFIITLAEGNNQIVVTVTKNLEKITKTIDIKLDTIGPTILVDTLPKLIDQKEVQITGRIEPGSILVVNGVPATIVHDLFTVKVPITLYANTLVFDASDTLGNKNSLTMSVYNYHQIMIKLTIGQVEATIEGKTTILDYPPYIKNSRTFVPIRFITEAFGATIEWEAKSQTIHITLGDMAILMQIGNNTVFVNGKSYLLDAAPEIQNSRTFVPIRFIAETFESAIDWDSTTQTIVITKLK